MKFQKINGMDFSRWVAAQLLQNSNLKGTKYYDKEDEYTEIIERCLQQNAEEEKAIYKIMLHCWDPKITGGFDEYNSQITTVFYSYNEALKMLYKYALEELEALNDKHYASIEEAEALQNSEDFRLDIDGENLCIIRKWDGDNYWPVTSYNIMKFIIEED